MPTSLTIGLPAIQLNVRRKLSLPSYIVAPFHIALINFTIAPLNIEKFEPAKGLASATRSGQ